MGEKISVATPSAAVVEVALDSSPWPLVRSDGSLKDGAVRSLPRRCITCHARPCRQHDHSKAATGTCFRHLPIFQFRAAGQPLCIPGAITKPQWHTLPRKRKKALKERVVSLEDVQAWVERVGHLPSQFNAAVDERVDETLGMFHDIQTTLSALIRSTETWLAKQPGDTRTEKMDALTPVELTIVKTVDLLSERIRLMPLVVNPAAASFGRKRKIPIYKACDRIVRILSPSASMKGIQLHLTGQSFNEPECYDSFGTIPLVLLDNAMKYSLSGQSVQMTINDGPRPGAVTVEVSCMSPKLTSKDRAQIFEKGYRGNVAEKLAARGAGLGLYLGQTVARAHATTIQHSSTDRGFAKDGIQYAENTFRVIFG